MIPSIIIDNFFETPDKVVELANSLEFSVIGENYPGRRTLNLDDIENDFAKEFADKVFFNFPFNVVSYDLTLSFQKIPYKFEHGIVHTDAPEQITAIVYLNEGDNTGTSLYNADITDRKDILSRSIDSNNPSEEDIQSIIRHNKQFKKTLDVSNVYNRAVIFNATTPHCANGFNGEERLTLLGFFRNIKVSNV